MRILKLCSTLNFFSTIENYDILICKVKCKIINIYINITSFLHVWSISGTILSKIMSISEILHITSNVIILVLFIIHTPTILS